MDDLLRRHNASAFDEATTIWIWNETDIPDWLKPDCGFCRLVKVIKDLYGVPSLASWNIPHLKYLYALRENGYGGTRAPPIPLNLKRYKDIRDGDGDGYARPSLVGREPESWTWVFLIASRSSVHNQGNLLVRTIEPDAIDFGVVRAGGRRKTKSATRRTDLMTLQTSRPG
jgi:hypothetical protein